MRTGLLVLALWSFAAAGAEQLAICHNYGCITETRVTYSERQLGAVRAMLASARDAEEERAVLSRAVGVLYAWAGRQSSIWRDRGGDYADENVEGKMDCIDHATSTTRLLRMLEGRGWLRFHGVMEPVRRTRFLGITQHFSAALEEKDSQQEHEDSAWPGTRRTVADVAAGHESCTGCSVPVAFGKAGVAKRRFVVDSWFFDNGTPAFIMPLDEWLRGGGPDV
jgi:hypothetical protein